MDFHLIPAPKKISGDGHRVTFHQAIQSDVSFERCANSFCAYAKKAYGIDFANSTGGILLRQDPSLPKGGYRLECNEEGVFLWASDSDGAAYALATLLQLLQPDRTLPCVTVTDAPDCEYRSLMVDLARRWHPFETLFRYVDICWLYKIKYLHLHFEDYQSYTLCSDVFPKLPTPGRSYLKEQIKQLNDYAFSRNVELIPEIEFPGHGTQKKLTYPELFGNTPISPDAKIDDSLLCVGKPGVMDSIRKLLEEVIALFPHSRYLHVGGDEALLDGWNYCADCLAYMERNNIPDVHTLYTHFTKEITDLVLELGKIPIVWEGFPKEGTENLSRKVLVMGWESYYHLPNELVEEGFSVVNASWQPLYITPDRYWHAEDILNWNVYNWQNWNKKTAAFHNPIQLAPTAQVKGALLGAWEWDHEGEFPLVKQNLAALSERTWNINSYVNREAFLTRLSAAISLADRILY